MSDWYGVTTDDNGHVTSLGLNGNHLFGSIPAELGSLTNLASLDLRDNSLSGCVLAALEAVRDIRFDSGLAYCAAARVSVTRARSGEGDGTVVFTAVFAPPDNSDAAAASPVSSHAEAT